MKRFCFGVMHVVLVTLGVSVPVLYQFTCILMYTHSLRRVLPDVYLLCLPSILLVLMKHIESTREVDSAFWSLMESYAT